MELMTTREAAAYIHMAEGWLEKRHAHGPRHIKLGRLVKYRKADLDRWVEECARKTKPRVAA